MDPAANGRTREGNIDFDPRSYWETRLNANFNLVGVGYRQRGLAFNRWIYEAKLQALKAALTKSSVGLQGARICEVGCGTGFYFPFWLAQEPRDLVGWDLTQVSVQRLASSIPEARFECRNLGEPLNDYDEPPFDFVAAVDVLFHIVEQNSFAQAIANLARITVPGGHVLISDYFCRRPGVNSASHVRYRSYDEYLRAMGSSALTVVGLYPQTYLMNAPMDVGNPILRYLLFGSWTGLTYLSRIELLGDWLGRWAYRRDAAMLRKGWRTPSSKILICRKRG